MMWMLEWLASGVCMVAFAMSAHSHPSVGASIGASAWAMAFGMHTIRGIERRHRAYLEGKRDRLADEIRSLRAQRDDLRRGPFR